jgi:heme/copper-type cytochrome/quinol oxidase subunit 3
MGLGALTWLWNGFRQNARYVDSFVYNLNPRTATVYQTATIFWHFLGILWLLLFLVLWVNQP